MRLEPLVDKWTAFGWAVREIDGNDMGQVVDALDSAPFEKGKPSLIMANTIKAKGLAASENRVDCHYQNVTQEYLESAVRELREHAGQRS